MHRTRLPGLGVAVAIGVLACLAAAGPATADDYATGNAATGTGYPADGATHDYCFYNVSYIPSLSTPVTNAMANLDAQTDMTDLYHSLCPAGTDVLISWVGSATLGSSVLGSTQCLALDSVGRCNQSRVLLNQDLLTTAATRQKTACHEIGHTAGLSHGSTYGGCMISGLSTNITYSSHHVAHINAAF